MAKISKHRGPSHRPGVLRHESPPADEQAPMLASPDDPRAGDISPGDVAEREGDGNGGEALEGVEVPEGHVGVLDGETGEAQVMQIPAGNASTDEWRSFVRHQNPPFDVETKSRDELRDWFRGEHGGGDDDQGVDVDERSDDDDEPSEG